MLELYLQCKLENLSLSEDLIFELMDCQRCMNILFWWSSPVADLHRVDHSSCIVTWLSLSNLRIVQATLQADLECFQKVRTA